MDCIDPHSRARLDEINYGHSYLGKNDFNMLLKFLLGRTDWPSSWILGLTKSRLGTGGAGGCVTLPMRKGNNAL
jgi:hypothetical protein